MNDLNFVSIGLFLLDDIVLEDDNDKSLPTQIGGGGTYATIGARIWLPPSTIGMIVDKGIDFPDHVYQKLLSYGHEMWLFREHTDRVTNRALISYRGDLRSETLTPHLSLFPRDLHGTRLARPASLHFICSPTRAVQVISEVDWNTTIIFEPIPVRTLCPSCHQPIIHSLQYSCVPAELPSLITVMASVDVLSPNAQEAFALLSWTSPITRDTVQSAALHFLNLGIGPSGKGCVIIRSAALGACVASCEMGCRWVDAFWSSQDTSKIVDVTGQYSLFLLASLP
ncbi:hypothetical protein JVU11DRAFT_1428 [Chiua virens]|nr:hypothetical protein JVU11DRAFT_1428 [Chiua virens]